jgi:hypothetical protein
VLFVHDGVVAMFDAIAALPLWNADDWHLNWDSCEHDSSMLVYLAKLQNTKEQTVKIQTKFKLLLQQQK